MPLSADKCHQERIPMLHIYGSDTALSSLNLAMRKQPPKVNAPNYTSTLQYPALHGTRPKPPVPR